MICRVCGAANEDGVLFCEQCKADLEMPSPATSPGPEALDRVDSPEEPIPLEPIALEPVAMEEVAPVESPPLSSTSDYPAVSAASGVPAEVEPAAPATADSVPEAPVAAHQVSLKLVVVRGQRLDVRYPLYPGKNYIGRTDDKPVDIDLEDQEAQDRIWSSRQHAVISLDDGRMTIEDLNSLNGTFVNRNRVHPGQDKELLVGDIIQIGTVHMKVVLE